MRSYCCGGISSCGDADQEAGDGPDRYSHRVAESPSAAITERAEPGAVMQLCQVAPGSLSSVHALSPERPSGVRGFGCWE